MKSPRVQIGLITLVALALRVIQLDAQPLWWDEGYSVFFATRAFGEMLARTAVDIHPPLYYAFLQAWIAVFGQASLILRLSSVILGVIAIPVAYWAFRPIMHDRAAIVASVLLALSPFHIFYSQELRMYGMLTLFAIAAFGFLVRLLSQTPGSHTNDASDKSPVAMPDRAGVSSIPLWAGLILCSTAALYTEYFGAFVIGAEIVIVLFSFYRQRDPRRFVPWALAFALVGLLYLPWVNFAAAKLQDYVANKQGIEQFHPLDPLTFFADHLVAFSVGHIADMTWLAWLGAILFIVILILGIIVSRAHPINLSPALYLGSVLLFAYALNIVYPFHPVRFERLLLFAAPFFYALLAQYLFGIMNTSRLLAYGAFVGVVIVFVLAGYNFYSTPRYTDEDYRGIIQLMRERATQDDKIIAVYPWQIGYLEAYWQAHPEVIEAPSADWEKNSQTRDGDLHQIDSKARHVWLMAYQKQGRILEAQIENYFAAHYLLTNEWIGNTRLELYARASDPSPTLPPVRFQENVTLAEFGFSPANVTAGKDFVLLYMQWQSNSEAFSYSIRLVDAAGHVVAHQDAPIYSDPPVQRRGLFVPASVTKGQYNLNLVVYRSQNGQVINALDGNENIRLADLTVQ